MNQIVEFKGNLDRLINAEELALPDNVSTKAFRNAAIVAVQDTPKILHCDNASVMKSLRTLAAAGLVPDGREAALVPFKTKDGDNWVDKCQAMPMVFGLIKMVRRSGEITDIRAHIVYQNEVDTGAFSYVVGDEEALTHKPILFGDRGDPVAAYAIAKMKDGTIIREFMTAQEIDTVRRSSAAQRVYEKGKKPTVSDTPIGIWKDWWAQMWEKTVIRRLCKRLDMSSEDMRRVMVEQDNLPTEPKDITPEENPLAAKAKAAREAAKEPEQEEAPTEDGDTIEGTAEHWTVGIDTGPGFPGSDDFTEGEKAARAGMKREMCPHEKDHGKAADWLSGFDEEMKRSEENV